MISTILLCLTIVGGLFTDVTYGYPSGAPKKICEGPMLPHHDNLLPQPSSTSPIKKFETKWNEDNQTMSIDIQSRKAFKGMFIQGRKPNGTEPIGTFINLPKTTHLVQCSSGDGITHSSPQKWKKLHLTWKKPESVKSDEKIQFWVVLVVDFKHFWLVKNFE